MRALPVFLVVLLVGSSLVGGALAPGRQVAASEDYPATNASPVSVGGTDRVLQTDQSLSDDDLSNRTIRVLDIRRPTLQRSTVNRETLNLGPALGFDANVTTIRVNTAVTVDRIESADSTQERRRLLVEELERLEQRSQTLRSRQAAAITSYARGRLSPREFVRELAYVDTKARALEDRRSRLATLSQEMDSPPVAPDRLAGLQLELLTLTGPVRQEAAAVLRGQQPAGRFFVAAGGGGVVLSVIQNDTYVREAYRPDLRTANATSPGPFTTEDALDTTARNYPTVWGLKGNSTEVVGSGSLYFVAMPHERGVLHTFVDGSSGRVFKSFQRRPLSSIAVPNQVSDVKDGLRLRVNRSYPGGPMRVNLTQYATGDPVRANITVGLDGSESTLVGRTDANGHLWTLAPRGRYTVTAILGNSVVVVSAAPSSIPHINESRVNGTNQQQSPNGSQGTQSDLGDQSDQERAAGTTLGRPPPTATADDSRRPRLLSR
jgi:hypothetical protein